MAITQNEALFALIGTTYGGDGVSTFGLPNLLGRVPIHFGAGYVQGQVGGEESVVLNTNQIPAHTHAAAAAAAATGTPSDSPTGNFWSGWTGGQYSTTAPTLALNAAAVGASGGSSLPHNNVPPYQAINFVIALFGVFPSQS